MNKTCKQCTIPFEVTDQDREFYRNMQVPPPTLCPQCRQRRRLTWRGERKLYNRKCDLCGKQIISVFAPDKIYTVYCRDCWWSDKWDPRSYGRDFDFTKPFFEQYQNLLQQVPLWFSYNIDSINSDYNNNVSYLKNCYLMSSSNSNEDCYYGYFVNDSKNCVDCTSVKKSELCYECVECVLCYNLKCSQNCISCTDSWFLQNCTSCKNCFGCSNLRHKEYYFFNRQLTKEDYARKMEQFHSGDREEVAKIVKAVHGHHLKYPYKYMVGDQNENATGNTVYQSKNALECYDCIQVEDCKYCYQMQETKNCMDVMTWGRPAELLYECMGTGINAYFNRFTAISQGSSYNTYCYMCMYSKNLFGCVSLNRGEYCILNRQYTKEEYEQLVPKIIGHMKSAQEWGEFLPAALSPFAYNEALSNDWLPLTREEAIQLGSSWREDDPTNKYEGIQMEVPSKLEEVTDEIVKQILKCDHCEKNYKIIHQELQFYRQMNLPAPSWCPDCRHKKRLKLKNPRRLWSRHCDKCKTTIQTTFAPERPEIVYCEKCYQEGIY